MIGWTNTIDQKTSDKARETGQVRFSGVGARSIELGEKQSG